MKKTLVFSVFVILAFVLSFSIHDARAVVNIDVKDQASCTTVPLSGTWHAVSSRCTIASFTLDSGDSLSVENAITLVTTGDFTNNGGTIYNSGTITNHGTINNNGPGGGILNYGTIDNEGKFNNNGYMTNGDFLRHIIGTINNSGTITDTLAGSFEDNDGTIVNTHHGHIINIGVILISPRATITNSGIIINNGGGPNPSGFTNEYGILNDGIITNNADGKITNTAVGEIINSKTIDNLGTITNNGKITNDSFGIINNSGTIINICDSTIENSGTISGNVIVNKCANSH